MAWYKAIEIFWKWLRGRGIDEQKKWDELYQARIKFLQDELEARKAEIEELKKKHPGNGKDYDEWQKQLDELYLRLYLCEKQKLELKGKIIFYEEEIKRLEKKHRSMYS
jgi:chromosome segregation ATPase